MKEKTLNKISKKISKPKSNGNTSSVHVTLKDQYEVIKQDVLKLRDDLSKGYDLVRNLIDKKATK